ncbi:MAG: hypothetical protein E6230_16670 [Paenibacillus dendritiformis]|uniref:hypothetical protein n=1 Tax=Paenibacillus dendritiformis TaxID=130049 RepID=UPI00143DB191|nr:hypothetical protein [Paenibacillus dendritiformis]MDU5143805.1 hypothetical protein [Paenibacillus dendritiformis]NKI22636.1 hypothetical protein [Paenibacillus dendritiformis]NRF96622.1 hypothetical protein [Paenibacillus dendritiformis]GIO71414.1 hypothetical protein J27TS7_09280 [Paenibacillus dendritiformis]
MNRLKKYVHATLSFLVVLILTQAIIVPLLRSVEAPQSGFPLALVISVIISYLITRKLLRRLERKHTLKL